MEKTLMNKLTTLVVAACAIGIPLVFLPSTINMFSTPKQALLTAAAVLLILAYGITTAVTKKLHIVSHAYIYTMIVFAVIVLLNLILNREGIFDALMGRGLLYLSLIPIAIAASSYNGDKSRLTQMFLSLTVGAVAVVAVHSLLQLIGLYRIPGIPSYMATRSFTLVGSPLTAVTFLVVGGLTAFMQGLKTSKSTTRGIYLGVGITATIASVAYISLMLPGSELALNSLPYKAAWSITLDALKSTRSLLLGIGFANFSSLYTAVKPLYLNTTAFWNVVPSTASSEVLQLVISLGLPGLIAFAILPLTVLPHLKETTRDRSGLATIFLLSLGSLILTPASIPVLTLFFISSALLIDPSEHTATPRPATVYLVTAACAALVVVTAYFTGKSYAAELHMYRAQKALAANDGKAVYEQTQKAVTLAPLSASYRLSYSQVNLSLASALSEKGSLSDQEREQVTTLVAQAIREGKTAASLRPNDARGWQNLGNIYRNLINVADKADQFTVTAYTQAIALSPADPTLRVEYGGLLYQLSGLTKDDESKKSLLASAIQQFQTAVQLKPDYANGYYNLSKALEVAGNTTAAYAAMQKAVASLSPDSQDLTQATTELEALKSKLPASPSPSPEPSPEATKDKQSAELSQPSPLPSPISGGPVTLPNPTE